MKRRTAGAAAAVGGVSDADDGRRFTSLMRGRTVPQQPLAAQRFARPLPLHVASNATLKHDTTSQSQSPQQVTANA
ncbi:hypothetical protein PLANPX_0036 [Lacipirellula parvula]|uniref:Uncharacterized protein n=1 Tax=Lacipirellula parvula TaxID=2650471 RepID=A0A5K7X1A8_9BACT|nr:hypothetical protein PLANPX_0036 [Lacipirellula parvula]